MPLTIPEPPDFLKPVIYVVVGEKWPQGDENKLLKLAEAWEQLAVDLEAVDLEVAAAAVLFRGSGLGTAFDAAEEYLSQFTVGVGGEAGVLPKLREAARDLADMCRKAAVQIQYAKLMIITMAAWLLQQLLQVAYLAILTGGAAAPMAEFFKQMAKMTVEAVLRRMVWGIFFQVALDAVVQTLQWLVNDNFEWDGEKTAFAAGVGALSGVIGAGIEGFGNKHMPGFVDSLPGTMLKEGLAEGLPELVVDTIQSETADPNDPSQAGPKDGF